MMGAMPQTPAQGGLAAIFAALGTAPAGSAGFERLFADLPALPVAAPGPPRAEAAAPALAAMPVIETADIPAAPMPDMAIAGETPALDRPAAPEAKPAEAAATAANLLIAAATGFTDAAPVTRVPAAKPILPPAAKEFGTKSDTDAEGAAAVEPSIAPAAELAPAGPDVAAAATLPPVAITAPAKPAAPAPRGTAKDEAAIAAPASLVAAAPRPSADRASDPAPALAGPVAAKPAATDGGASMTIVFAQPATPAASGTAPVAEAATAAPVAERVLDLASDDAWIAQLASDIAATKSDSGDISFRLLPRHLGRLDVAMSAGDEGVSLKLDTQHEATAQVVHAAQGKLVDDLRQQGVRVAGAEVTCTPGETGRQPQQGRDRAPAPDPAHLIETATEAGSAPVAASGDTRTAARRGRFA